MAAFRRFANLFRRSRVDREIADELQSHIELRVDSNLAAGMSPGEARRDALLRFGNPTSTRERVASADAALRLASVWADVRYGGRQLIKSPGFAITAVLTLAIGIGANTAIFSSMDAVVLHPISVPDLNQVVTLAEEQGSGNYHSVALANYYDWSRQNRSFEQLAVRTYADMSLIGGGDAAHVQAALTSANFFGVLRAQPLLGRVFVDSECQQGHDAVAVLNYGFWQRRFAGDPSILGRKIELDQRLFTIVGVMPKTMQYPSMADLFLPLAPTPQQVADRSSHDYLVTGRLRRGVTVKQAQAEMRIDAERLAKDYPATNLGWSVKVEPLLDGINGDSTLLYYRMLMGATLFVLLVVCANVTNLQFARGIARRSEIAMRSALGASRLRIMRQLLTENVLLGLVGAGGGLLFGGIYLHFLIINMPPRIARYMAGWSNTSLNWRVMAFSLLIALGAGIISGIAPAIEAMRMNLVEQLKAGSRGTTGSGRHGRLRNIFAVSQIALAVALVIGAALMSKGMLRLLHLGDVYEPNKTLTWNVTLPPARYDTPQKLAAWYSDSLEKLRALPGVTHAEVTTSLPYSDNGWLRDVTLENRPAVPGKFQSALHLPVSDGYFAAFHLPIVSGRSFVRSDAIGSQPVAIVSRKFVTQYFPGQNPIGHRIRMGDHNEKHEPWLTIVGIAEDTSYSTWDQSIQPVVYMSAAQIPPPGVTYAVMTDGDPLALAPPARKALASLDPSLPLDGVMTYEQSLHEALTGLIDASVMLGIDALIALLLAAIGIFGVMANLVGEQTREIGVRLAMGAPRERVLLMVLRRASWLTAIGLGCGLLLAFGLAQLVANLLRGVSPHDPVIFVGVSTAITVIAIGSSWIPARHAARVDPMQALRGE
ncbi:MAG TPA: ABC transporter permease [Terracidiphilus sp.]|jgi:putative ABC transport system permease protein